MVQVTCKGVTVRCTCSMNVLDPIEPSGIVQSYIESHASPTV